MRPAFQNEPLTDFADEQSVRRFQAALMRERQRLGATCSMLIDGSNVNAAETFASTCPSDPEVVIARFPRGTTAQAATAIEAAERAFPAWSRVPPEQRAQYLFSVAGRIRRERDELAALLTLEVGKSWDEADGEVAEVADLLEYYARQILELQHGPNGRLGKLPNEATDFFYVPLGVGAVISPWNFPMALTFGMAGAAVVAGNTVVIKPASTSPASVYRIAEIFRQVGLPPGVMNMVTGSGSVIGNTLVDHPRTRFVAFTGSMEVGIQIFERASRVQPGQIWLKRTVLEMGGKNAVIVDAAADIDQAVEGVTASAFGFQGQKCSAGSRAIIDESIYATFIEKLVARTGQLRVGAPESPDVQVGPVIDGHAFKSILDYIETGKGEGRLLFGGRARAGKGYLIEPTIFGDVDPQATIAQEEIFGPVLACIKSRNFDHALEIANGTRYGLTGAVYSQDRGKLERARRDFHVGNLYFNRKSTGALMGVHPFGGFNMSGTDSKAGGPDYLLLFLQGKSIGDRLQ